MGARSGEPQAVLFVRPVLILAAAAVAGAVALWVLMHEPPGGPGRLGRLGRIEERLSTQDRLALERRLGGPAGDGAAEAGR